MKTYVVGDIHGAGEEVVGLLDKMSPATGDRIVFVGDVFDRGIHAPLVWDRIKALGVQVFMGNHEYKMLHWLQGRRDFLPLHYYVALNLLMDHGVKPAELLTWLESLPLLKQYEGFLIAHAAVDLSDPLKENVSWNVFGNMSEPMPRPQVTDPKKYFWDLYQGDELVVYGHLVTPDNLPRIRRNEKGKVNSVGLDTAAVHGGPLTGMCVEDFKFFSYRSGKDWGLVCKDQIKKKPPTVGVELMKFVSNQRSQLRARLSMEKAVTATKAAMALPLSGT